MITPMGNREPRYVNLHFAMTVSGCTYDQIQELVSQKIFRSRLGQNKQWICLADLETYAKKRGEHNATAD
jgi:hypothetical protein